MKELIKNLEVQYEKLRKIIKHRDSFVDLNSDNWQDLNACEVYVNITSDIEDLSLVLFDVIKTLKKYS